MPTMGHALLALNFKKFIICIDLFCSHDNCVEVRK